MSADPTPTQQMIEVAVRRYLTRLSRRFVPLALPLLVLILVVALVPAAQQAKGSGAAAGSSVAASPSDIPSIVASGAATPAALGSGAAQGGGLGQPGLTAGGQHCGPGVRQVPWSGYSAMCVPSFHGNNGGATSYGVTPTTITMSFRISDSGEAGAVAAASPGLNTAAQTQYFNDLQTYAGFFNKQFELYGRHVVLKQFTGQGDWVREYQSQDLAGAQADADTARSMGAFADISSSDVSTTPPYAQYLADDHVLSVGGVAASESFFNSYAPYVYTAGGNVSNFGQWASGLVCQRLGGLPAIFSGDTTSQIKNRVFGLVYPTNPDFQTVGNAIKANLQACGYPVAKEYQYALDISTMAAESQSAMAQMNQAGVTTVICGCDTVVPTFLGRGADAQQYHPEWLFTGGADSLTQGYSQTQWNHAMAPQGTYPPNQQSEAYHVYKMASGGQEPNGQFYPAAYQAAILFFDALQSAGPSLGPSSFANGFFSLPASVPGGFLGPWSFGRGHYTSLSGAPDGWYNPSAISGQNGAAGAWVSCAGSDGQDHPWAPYSGYGPARTQPHCFGR